MIQIHILHIVNSYGGTSVYKNLFTSLDKLGIRQTIFVSLNSKNYKRKGNHKIDFQVEGSSIIYSTGRRWYHKFAYDAKVNLIKKELLNVMNIQDIDLIHSHNWCLDGGVAYKLYREFNIPYIIAIRNTDINAYYKKMFWKRSFFKKILLASKKTIFISPSYKKMFFESIVNFKIGNKIKNDILLLPNGIDPIFLNNRITEKKINSPIQVVYSGAFQKGKNIHRIIEAIDKLIRKGYKIKFAAIGIGLASRNNDVEYINSLEQLSEMRDWVSLKPCMPQNELCKVFAQSDVFVMPSVPETFGLVYVEALTQGLPILYSKGQGFDGFYEDGLVGYSVSPFDINDIAEKLEMIINNYDKIQNNIQKISLEQFNWNNIADKYLNLYKIINK